MCAKKDPTTKPPQATNGNSNQLTNNQITMARKPETIQKYIEQHEGTLKIQNITAEEKKFAEDEILKLNAELAALNPPQKTFTLTTEELNQLAANIKKDVLADILK